jgi:hypothetical protein
MRAYIHPITLSFLVTLLSVLTGCGEKSNAGELFQYRGADVAIVVVLEKNGRAQYVHAAGGNGSPVSLFVASTASWSDCGAESHDETEGCVYLEVAGRDPQGDVNLSMLFARKRDTLVMRLEDGAAYELKKSPSN